MEYYKILNERMNHNGFQYQLGLNVDTKEFKPEGSCQEGGLYFTTKEHLFRFFEFGIYIADISLCSALLDESDSLLYKDPRGDKLKTNKFIITKITLIKDHELGKLFVKQKSNATSSKIDVSKLIENKEYLEAVKQNGLALEYIENQTDEICMEAVKQNCWALQFVKNQTHKIILEASKRDWRCIKMCMK